MLSAFFVLLPLFFASRSAVNFVLFFRRGVKRIQLLVLSKESAAERMAIIHVFAEIPYKKVQEKFPAENSAAARRVKICDPGPVSS
jgi:hypothetical protein